MKDAILAAPPRFFKNLLLDEFQSEAIWHLQRNTSTLVSAPTGTGKTVIADFLVDACIKSGKRIAYTAPVKALVNQKFRNYAQMVGRNQVGILTGDLSENPDAPVLLMTTEVFRNMLVSGAPTLKKIAWVVFDEIHYLDHAQRGTVWEEAIMLMPPAMKLLGLSATVPNASEIADWIESVHKAPVAVVSHTERAVPLEHLYYNRMCGTIKPEKLMYARTSSVLAHKGLDIKAGFLSQRDLDGLRSDRDLGFQDDSNHLDMVRYVAANRLFPCLYFVMSRRGCEEKAHQLAAKADYLRPREKEAVRVAIKQELTAMALRPDSIPRFAQVSEMWRRGIAFHHAGMLPATKQIVETLLERKLLRVLYATETFAVGVNMPVRTVCFDSLKKYDGREVRYLTQGEYFQMAGRAGRRGFDHQGTVLIAADFGAFSQQEQPPIWDEQKLEPINSKIQLSFNFVANLAARWPNDRITALLSHSLAGFQNSESTSVFRDFDQKREILRRLDYLNDDGLLPRGEVCRHLHVQEILITELIFDGVLADMDTETLAGFAAALVYEPRPAETAFPFVPPRWLAAADIALARVNQRLDGFAEIKPEIYPAITPLIRAWVQGRSLNRILRDFPMSPGDFVTACRRAIDLLRQISDAIQALDRASVPAHTENANDTDMPQKIKEAITALDRHVVSVKL